ncbi:MAG: hypothetical protein LBD30_07900 [Verrucomicrobiales bacterium]|nr:hypothetical protein [Verrucomicrobiales bacterium]
MSTILIDADIEQKIETPLTLAGPPPGLPPASRLTLLTRALQEFVSEDTGLESSPVSTVHHGKRVQIERYVFIGPESTHHPFRLAFFGALRGDDRYSPYALTSFIRDLIDDPELATGFHLYFYPVANPTQYVVADGESGGRDLFADLWRDSSRPEPYLIERELAVVQFHGVIALFTPRSLSGLAVQLHGSWSSLKESLVGPVLADAAEFSPLAAAGDWVASRRLSLTSGGNLRPKPFELSVKIPRGQSAREQILALRVTLHSILRHYRTVVAESQHL